ncbi:MAG TPA: LamG domain-containing protein [Verrucomicrobiae bacterium]|nr:LamG domain-containing protein [Verrucomicrobiae bacterium]
MRTTILNPVAVAHAMIFLSLLSVTVQAEPSHPILSIPGTGSGAGTILSSWTEQQYTNNFVPRQSPRNDDYGFVPPVVSGDTAWSWSLSAPNQIKSMPSGAIFPGAAGYTVHTQAVNVLSGKTVQVPCYLRAGSSSAKSLVFALIDFNKRNQLRSDLNKLAAAYIKSGATHATRNQNYARRIAVALLDWARCFPDYFMTEKNSATFLNVTPGYILPSDKQRASDHNGLAHEWADDEVLAFDAIYDSPALANLSTELGFNVRDYIATNLFCNEGDFLVYHVPPEVATDSNLSGPFTVLGLVARVLNRPDYILWLDEYLGITVREKIHRDGALSEGMAYSLGYINENLSAARNTRDYFLSRPAATPELQAIKDRVGSYVNTLQFGQEQWSRVALPNGQLPSFGDTPFNTYFTARYSGNSALLPSYGTVALGAGSTSGTAVQLNQNFSGDNNHMRSDTTAFTLWAFGNEVLGNIRYHNGTPGRQFTEQALAYNTVTIDRTDLTSPSANTYGNGDLMLYEPGINGLAVTEIDGQRAYANKASRYQRILLLNTFDLDRPYVVDVFRVTGGSTHDYVFHGSIRYDQNYECSFPLVTNTATYPMLEGGEVWKEPTSSGTSFPYYGFWRNVSSNRAPGNFQITYRDTSSAHRDTRLWMIDDGGANVYIGRTPVPSRANGEPENYWANNLWRPSAIIRKRIPSGTLSDLFISVIEPLKNGVGTIVNVERLPMNGSNLESVGLRITFSDGRVDTCLINLRNPQVAGANLGGGSISTLDEKFMVNGRIGVHTDGPAGGRVWAVNASRFEYSDGVFTPTNLLYSGQILGETRKLAGGDYDAFLTTTPLPLGMILRGRQLSLTFGTLSGTGTSGISEMFEIDQVIVTNGVYQICLTHDPMLEITNVTTTVEQMAPLRRFSGINQFEITLSASKITSPPIAPINVFGVSGNTQVQLHWNAVGATAYNIKRSLTSGGPYLAIGTTTNTTFTDSGLINDKSYYYVVSGVNGLGEGPSSVEMKVTPTDAPMGLVARLTFDDGTARDSSGYGNDGTLKNGAVIVTDAERGPVLHLDGTDDWVDLGNGGSLKLSDANQATISAWIKVAASRNQNTILSKGEWKQAYSLLVKGDSTPKNQLWTGNDISAFSGEPVPLNVWTHVAVTIDGDLTTFFINGQRVGVASQDRGDAIDDTATGVSIGREQYPGAMPAGRWFFDGEMDDVRIYERALTEAEIQSVMVDRSKSRPQIAAISVEHSNLILSGTNGAPGTRYCVLTSTNLMQPVTLWTILETNRFDVNGSFSVTNTMGSGTSQRFYILQLL